MVVTLLVATVQIEQHILRRRAGRLLRDIRSLQIGKATFSEVQGLGHKWGRFTHWEKSCTAQSCGFEILWVDFFASRILASRILWSITPKTYHWLIIAGLRPQQVFADLQVEDGVLAKENFHVTVGAPGDWDSGQWWDYGLIGSASSPITLQPSVAHQLPPQHPLYYVTMPSGCEICKSIGFVFDPSLDSATFDRLMQFDFSCLTRWVHPCRTEADIMPNAWAQLELDRPSRKQ